MGEGLRLRELLPRADRSDPSTSTTFWNELFGQESKTVQDEHENNAGKAPCEVKFPTDEELDEDSVRELPGYLALCEKPC